MDKELIEKYFEGRCTPEEAARVEEGLWKDFQGGTDQMPADMELRLKSAIVKRPRRMHYYWLSAAAVVLAVVVMGVLWKHQPKSFVAYEISNTEARPSKTQLADGSTVWLNTGSKIYVSERKVRIEGEAYFDIKHDASRPFYVEAGNTTTEVLGTTFTVEAWPTEQQIRVSLLKGKIAVGVSDHRYVLEPGQMAAYENGNLQVAATPIEDPSAWINGKIVLNKIALPEAMDRLSRLYHTPILYDPAMIKGKYISGEFDRDDLPVVLKSVLFVHNLKFRALDSGGYRITN